MKKEIRALSNCELRAAVSGRRLSGYAAVFNSLSDPIGDFRERILPGAFRRTLQNRADVRALVDHDPSRILGRTKSGTLKLSEDSIGLHFEVEVPETSVGNDVLESVRRGDVSQCSFGFFVRSDRWMQGKPRIRELIEVDLFDVSVVTYPAYPDTSVSARSNDRSLNASGVYAGVPPVIAEQDQDRLRLQLAIARRL